MHDSEKSDSAIVAVKSPNNAGPPAAEAVEPRAGAKGNADQQSTHRTQSRKRVTQALSHVRQAARHRKKERFVIEDQQIEFVELGNGGFESELAAGNLQSLDEIGGAGEQDAPAIFDKGEAESRCKVALAAARWPKQQ